MFNFWDLGFGVLVLISAYVGYSRGALVDTVETLVFFIAIVGGLVLGVLVGDLIFGTSPQDRSPWGMPVGFIVVFSIVTIVGGIIRKLIKSIMGESELRAADRTIGLALGVFRGFLLVLVIIACVLRWLPNSPKLVASFSYNWLAVFHEDTRALIEFLVSWVN